MPISVSCGCGKTLQAPDNLAGKRAKCPACGGAIAIPAPSPPPAAARPGIALACGCGKRFQAPPQLAGKQTRCPACGGTLTIPSAATAPAPSAADDPFGLGSLDLGAASPIATNPLGAANPAGFATGFPPAYAPPRPAGNPHTKRLLIWGGVGGGIVIALVGLIAIGVWGIGQARQAALDAREPRWEPDAALTSRLLVEQEVGAWAIRPHPQLERTQGTKLNEDGSGWIHQWRSNNSGPQMAIAVTIGTSQHKGPRDPQETTPFAERLADLYVQNSSRPLVGTKQIEYGRLGPQRLVRVSYEIDTRGMGNVDGQLYARYNRLWLCQDDNLVVSIQIVGDKPFDDPEWQLLDASIRTFRRREGTFPIHAGSPAPPPRPTP